MNSYELSRAWFDWCFENPDVISPNHTAMYFFIIEHCNRLGWKAKFGLPMEMTKSAIGISNYRTFSKTFNDLINWGFIIMYQKSKNQYSSNIIGIAKNAKARTKALDIAIQKHVQKQVHGIVGIDKPNNNIKPNNQFKKEELSRNEIFANDLLASESWIETVSMQNKLSTDEIPKWIDAFNKKLISELDNKNSKKDFASHFSRWLPGEILKTSNKNGKSNAASGTGFDTNR